MLGWTDYSGVFRLSKRPGCRDIRKLRDLFADVGRAKVAATPLLSVAALWDLLWLLVRSGT